MPISSSGKSVNVLTPSEIRLTQAPTMKHTVLVRFPVCMRFLSGEIAYHHHLLGYLAKQTHIEGRQYDPIDDGVATSLYFECSTADDANRLIKLLRDLYGID